MINGTADPRFAQVQAAFEENFTNHGEVGAGLAVFQYGSPVVDLWGGPARPDRNSEPGGEPWRQNTLAPIASVTKTLAVTAMLVLADRGEIGLDDRIAHYWPEFAAEGKGDITLRTLMSHRAGIPSLAHSPMTYEGLLKGTPIFEAIAAARPEWEPGTDHGYHGVTIGHALSAVIQRITGLTVGKFFAKEVAGPLGLDAYIGLPSSELPRLASLVVPDDPESVQLGMNVPELRGLYEGLNDPESLTYRAMYGSMAIGWESADDPRFVQVEGPSTDGVASAHGLAGLYAALIEGMVSRSTMEQAWREHSSGMDRVLRVHTRIGLGFMLPGGPLFPEPAGPGAFGHGGATGSFAFADPDHGIAFGYVPNRGSELLEGHDLRVSTVVAALYRCL
ncbi:CubicO group peptidase (beta-lactamase class C family) [Kibdelosporangium banguiense]|uniref:CubicO group peptidase (Beta-lactamase class C family) n=1 Tax=Kibdelosporangium banguiense TaxID=1365924 RepID=A0ABS4U028_9PSEU|nr:serine hydrolase domain-containing protein [Kibdelosporangium banguiense]MBP2330013.1 CubicO group peptidase (beta-lactamase class C family) [Kibdelosporangium banguiense]